MLIELAVDFIINLKIYCLSLGPGLSHSGGVHCNSLRTKSHDSTAVAKVNNCRTVATLATICAPHTHTHQNTHIHSSYHTIFGLRPCVGLTSQSLASTHRLLGIIKKLFVANANWLITNKPQQADQAERRKTRFAYESKRDSNIV